MDARTIIDELGGYRTVASALGLRENRVHNWTRRGIASKHWHEIVALAAEQNKKGITFDALKANRLASRATI